MAETPPKRQREESSEENADPIKRQKPYDQILSLLLEQEQEPNHKDFSSMLTTLQREHDEDPFSAPGSESDPDGENPTRPGEEEKDEAERFMRHLLEASDDELGLPHRVVDGADGDSEGMMNGVDEMLFCDGLWDFENEAANYHSVLQSQLFMI